MIGNKSINLPNSKIGNCFLITLFIALASSILPAIQYILEKKINTNTLDFKVFIISSVITLSYMTIHLIIEIKR